MNKTILFRKFLLIFILCLSFSTQDAWAYIDAGTGSMIIQMVIAFFAGAIYIIKVNMKRIKMWFSDHFPKKNLEDKNG